MLRKILSGLILLIIVGLAWLTIAPPDLIRVGANYTAKMICSNVVLTGRNPDDVLKIDVQAPGHPLLKLMRYSIDERAGTTVVRTGLFGFIGKGLAFGTKERGCTIVPDARQLGIVGAHDAFIAPKVDLNNDEWPQGNTVNTDTNQELEAVLNDPALAGEGMRAIVIVKDGRIIAERYGQGFDEATPLLGWSMTKTVTAALIGVAQKRGILSVDDTLNFDSWRGDNRDVIRVRDLMAMVSDLEWNEGYGSVSDVTRMLYLEEDMAAFAAGKPIDSETPEPTGDIFEYSSGSSVILSKYWQNAVAKSEDPNAFPSEALFEPLGMASAVLEQGAAGNFVGGSYLYATARDWARFGQLLLQRGAWNGVSLLPTGYVDWMTDIHPASSGKYGRGHLWRLPPAERETQVSELPQGTFWAAGHDGQSIAIIPENDIVIVRLGLTPSNVGYMPGKLAEAVIQATK
ncbi:serine hydrolase [Ahrensia sp. 13_GOM-1096m]|uniref:serine hydrolase domain-containing protein n=1 Tax=Ahrensia sp. 13_GOM-1096m TaxID=1380380 RepID=UPI00047B8006|nr:serine hydrolase [Ahrensia sp. 13_GOM-1096m]